MNNDNFEDYAAIRKLFEQYIEGGVQGKSAIWKPIFHRDAIMYGQRDGKLVGGPIQHLYDAVDNGPPARDLKAVVTSIEVHEAIASARVESSNWNGTRFTDMFILVKDGGEWKILTKVYHVNA